MNLTEHNVNGIVYLASDAITAASGVTHGFSTRLGGVSQGIYASLNLGANRGDDPLRVRENYRRFCAALGANQDAMVFSSQVHGAVVRTVTAADAGRGLDRPVDYDADGLITDVPGVPLVVFGADCLTILLSDPVRRVIAAVHAGWRGTALGIVDAAVEKMMRNYGSDPADIRAAIGPGISRCCFETDSDVPDAMTEALGDAASPYLHDDENGKFHVDLKGINALRLSRLGVLHTDVADECTMCRPDEFWSHRVTQGHRGSQAALIQLL